MVVLQIPAWCAVTFGLAALGILYWIGRGVNRGHYFLGRIEAQFSTVVRVQDGIMQRQIAHEDRDAQLFSRHGERLAAVEERVGIVKQQVADVVSDLDREA